MTDMSANAAQAVKDQVDWRDILRKAADYIRNVGFLQGDFGKAGGPVCTNGALRLAAGYELSAPRFNETKEATPGLNKAMRAFMFAATPEPKSDMINALTNYELVSKICDINNSDGQTGDTIAAMMEKAAADADPDDAPTRTDQPAAA